MKLFPLLALLVAPAAAQEPDPRALKDSSLVLIESVNRLLATPINVASIPVLKEAAETLVRDAGACAQRAYEAKLAAQAAHRAMEDRLKGRGLWEALDRRYEREAAKLEELKSRLRRAQENAEALKPLADGPPRPQTGEDGEAAKARQSRAKECLERAREHLERADRHLKNADERLRAMDAERVRCQENLSRAAGPRDELSRLSAEIARRADSLTQAQGELRARLEAMTGRPDDNETRGRVYPKHEALAESGRGVYEQSQTAQARLETLREHSAAFAKAHARFEEDRKASAGLLSEAQGELEQAEPCLKKARE